MKRILLSILILAALLPINAENLLYLGYTTCTPGESVTLLLFMRNDVETPSWQFEMTLPSGFTVAQDPTDADYLYVQLAGSRSTTRKHSVVASMNKSGNLFVTCSSDQNKTFSTGDGIVCSIVVKADSNIMPGDYTFTIKDAVITDAATNQSIYTQDKDCRVTVLKPTGMLSVTAHDAAADVYSLNGQHSSTPQRGLNIVKTANGVAKVIKK